MLRQQNLGGNVAVSWHVGCTWEGMRLKTWDERIEEQRRIFGHLSTEEARVTMVLLIGGILTMTLKKIAPSEETSKIVLLHREISERASKDMGLNPSRQRADLLSATLYQRAFRGDKRAKALYEICDSLRRACEPDAKAMLPITVLALMDCAEGLGFTPDEIAAGFTAYAGKPN